MKILDTDMFTLMTAGQPKVTARLAATAEAVAITIITRIEALQGRFSFLMKAANAEELVRAQQWLRHTEAELARLPVVVIDDAAAAEFDSLLAVKGLRRIGRGDLLIAATTLARKATLVTRNLKDFRKVPGLRVENWAD